MTLSIDHIKDQIKAVDLLKRLREKAIKGDVYLVGGSIREFCLSSIPKDYDFVVTHGDDIRAFEEITGTHSFVLGKKPIHTYRIVKDDINIDINVLDTSLDEDIKRRDFTINAIAYDIKGDALIDIVNGLADIEKRIIRHIKRENLINDPLRMLKAVRHYATLNGFQIHEGLYAAISDFKGHIKKVAQERIKYELDQIITSKVVFDAIKIMESTGLLFELFPELYELKKMDEEKRFSLETLGHTIDGFKYLHQYSSLYSVDKKGILMVGYSLLFHDLGKAHTFSYDENKKIVHFFYHEQISEEMATAIMERMRFSVQEIKTVRSLIKNHMRIFLISSNDTTERAIRRVVFKMGELTPLLILLSICDMYGSSGGEDNESTKQVKAVCGDILKSYEKWKEEPLPRLISGYDLMSIGFKEGPPIGRCLVEIQERQISGEIKDRDSALEYARQWLKINGQG
ncbi:MAG: HD domain-containing protein [Syntrophorhabdaceae bacterium]|nr:HD domain-containing protein [Syntrophorhabdaceae bacterium]